MNAPTFIRISIAISLLTWSASFPQSSPLDSLNAGEWYEVPNSKLEAVKPNPLPPGSVSAVMDAWSGGAYDDKRDRLIVWGGGHGDYSGNEVYVFDVRQLKWTRVNDPSPDVGGIESSGYYPDGGPRSRHTYNYIQYVPGIDRFCTFGGAGFYPSGQTGTYKTLCFNFDTRQWEKMSEGFGANIGKLSGVDAAGHVWVHGAGGNPPFSEWDPVADRWTSHSVYGVGWLDYYLTASVGQKNFLALGGGKMLLWDLAHPTLQPLDLTSSGDNAIVAKNCPGLDYDPVSGKFIAWSGGSDVYALDLSKRAWSKITPAATNKIIPTAAQNNGTFGRFRYIKSRNLFIAVNRTNENVFFYKLSAGGALPIKILNGNHHNQTHPAVNLSGTQIRFYAPINTQTKAWDTRGKNILLDAKRSDPLK